MNKNVKIIFLVLAILTLLVSVSGVYAEDNINSTDCAVSTQDSFSSPQDTDSNVISQQAQSPSDNNIQDSKNIEKTNQDLKKDSITIDEIEYTNIIENEEITTNTILGENTYINNCNIVMGQWDKLTNNATTYINNSIINATINNPNTSKLYIRNSTVSGQMENNASVIVTNTMLNMILNNQYGILTVSDDSILAEDFIISTPGEIIINDSTRLLPHIGNYNGNITIENGILSGYKSNEGNLTLINCQVAYTQQRGIDNWGNLTLINSSVVNIQNRNNNNIYAYATTFSGSLQNSGNITLSDDITLNITSFTNYGTIIINNSNIIYPYLRSFKGNHHLSNMAINKSITNDVESNLTLSNVTINQTITNLGTLIIDDDCVFASNARLTNNGVIIINDTNRIYPYTNLFGGESILSNITIDKPISNTGNLTLKNVTVSSTINNNGILIIDDDCTFTANAEIYDYGEIIINDTNRITPYLPIYNGDYTIENAEIETYKTNNGDLTIINSTIAGEFYNYGTITFENSVLNGYIENEGTLIISDDTQLGDELYIGGEGEIITNNTDALIPHIAIYNGDYTIVDTVLEDDKGNYGNLTIINSTLYNYMENYGSLTVINTLLDGSIYNEGILNISDDCEIGDNFYLSGNGEVICSDISKLLDYMNTLNGNYTIEGITITGTKTNNGNLTVINSTLDCTLTNNGVLTISNDTEFGDNFRLLGNGAVICDDFNKILPYLSTINGNYTFEDWNITKDVIFYGNIELVNCNINAKITNYENLTITNSSLSNNQINVPRGKEDGFLINNMGNLELIGCIMENNTFDTTITYEYGALIFYGAIVNNANMTITGSRFKNNKLGHYFAESYNNYYGNSFGNGSIVYNNGILTIDKSNFTENYAGSYGGAINSAKNLTVTNSNFNDNTAIVGGGAIAINKGRAVITDTNFTGNNATLRVTINELCGGGAIYASNAEMIIDNCVFDNNQAICYITGLAGVNSNGGSIAILQMNTNITNSTFKNHQKEVIQGEKHITTII